MTLGGNVCVRNALDLDYCFRECIGSLLPVCDVVNACDAESTDGTREALELWAESEPKLRILNYPYAKLEGNPAWMLDWLNWSRERLGTDYHIMLEADEVLHEDSYSEVLAAVGTGHTKVCRRLNFWKDASHLIPPGHILSPDVLRVALTSLWMGSDSPHPKAHDLNNRSVQSEIKIAHYGFLRRPQAYIKKRQTFNQLIWGTQADDKGLPTVIEDVEAGRNWADRPWFGETKPLDFNGTHPAIIKPWLKERGYTV